MSKVKVRILTEDEWPEYRELRLAALRESPHAFLDSYDVEVAYEEDRWRSRMRRAARLLATRDGGSVGIASVGVVGADPTVADIFGLWVDPAERHTGVAWALMEAAVDLAARQGLTQLHYWTGNENMRAIAFASNFGFLLSHYRRPARVPTEGFGDQEVAMVLNLDVDPGVVPNPTSSSASVRSDPAL